MIRAIKKIIVDWDIRKSFEIIKKGGLYFGSSVLGMVLSFFTFPIYSEFLSAEDFAIFNYFNNITGFFVFAFTLQFSSYFSSQYFRSTDDEKKVLTGTLLTFLIFWNPVVVCLIYFILVLYCTFIDLNLPYYPYLIFSLLITATAVYKGFFMVKLRLDGNAKKFFLINSVHKLIVVILSVSLMYLMYNHLVGRLWGMLMAEVGVGVFCVVAMYKHARFTINKKEIKKALKFIYPLLGASLVYYPITGFDQLVLERLDDAGQLGYYTLGVTFASYLFVFNSSLLLAIEPDIIKCTISRNFGKLYKIIGFFVGFCIVNTIVFIQISYYLIDFLTNGKFILSTGYSNVFAISFIFVIVFSITNIMLIALQKNNELFYTNLIGCLCCIVIYIFCAFYLGFYGVAYGRVFLFIVLSFVAGIFIYKELKQKSFHIAK